MHALSQCHTRDSRARGGRAGTACAGKAPGHTKHLNTPRLVADDTQKTVWKWEQQEPFGVNAANEDPDADSVAFEFNFRFPGQYYDRENNAHYNYFRDYHPSLGRYVQGDPIGLSGGLNLYAYAINAPTMLVDPTGEVVVGAVGAIAGRVAMGVAANYITQVAFNYGSIRSQEGNPWEKLGLSHRCVDWAAVAVGGVLGGVGVPGFIGTAAAIVSRKAVAETVGHFLAGTYLAHTINRHVPDIRKGCEEECKDVGPPEFFKSFFR